MNPAYITALGKFLPGPPISNEQMEDYLGRIHGKPSRARARILKQNGIEFRHYAIDTNQRSQYSNAEMAARAASDAVARAGCPLHGIDFLAAATSQGDFPLPGFASFVQAELGLPTCEIASHHGVCVSGLAALKHAALQVESRRKIRALACASEFASRLLKASRYEAQPDVERRGLSFDAEFLRWMLSDGAGAALIEPQPARGRLSLRVHWIEIRSYANRFAPCMYVGPAKNGDRMPSWLDYATYQQAADAGAINLRQDIRMLDDVVKCAVDGAVALAGEGRFSPYAIDWIVAHYSSNFFLAQSQQLAQNGGIPIPPDRWFSNLRTKGNIGSASVYVLLEELLNEGRLAPGQRILCVIPESGRFQFGYALLEVVEGSPAPAPQPDLPAREPTAEPDSPSLAPSTDPLVQSLMRQLAQVWFEFLERLRAVPLIARLEEGSFTLDDYKALLLNLRQQVIDGSRWISRAASNITGEFFPIRSAFIRHSQEEHRDYEMIERNYESVGGSLDQIRGGQKNIGSEALSAYILQKASVENPFDLIGAMYIIEGLGQRVARRWGTLIRQQLGLTDDQVSFFLYHSESDIVHFKRLDQALSLGILNEQRVAGIVKCAKVVARLYLLQLEEIGNY